MFQAGPVSEEYSLGSAEPPRPEQMRDALFPSLSRLTFGLVTWRPRSFWLGPLELFRFDEPAPRPDGWAWPIAGGLLVAQPGGATGVGTRPGEVHAFVEGYLPRLPDPVYRLVQLPAHRLLTRIFLLQQRGRQPPPDLPAAPAARLAAAGIDVALCAFATALFGRRRLLASLLVPGVYHLGFWSLGGQTPGARLLGLRLVSLDGSRLSPGQALIRLLAVPQAVLKLRAVHDELAGTDVVNNLSPDTARTRRERC